MKYITFILLLLIASCGGGGNDDAGKECTEQERLINPDERNCV